jgi:hypothetical protein
MFCYWYSEELNILIPIEMKKYILTTILTLLVAAGTTVLAQNRPDEYLGLPGDNLNLYAVMKLFQESETLEGFERSLNDENSRINNLDLNGDNLIDYIMVTDHPDGDVHNIVLQVALNGKERQDVAVFTVQRFHNGSAQIQLIGDEALYGKNYIIEPIYDDNSGVTPNPGYSGSSGYRGNNTIVRSTTFEVAAWPLIRFIYLPGYITWHSSWNWGYYPSYWHPWRPFYWDYYYGYQHNWYPDYYRHYRHWDNNRYSRYHDFYYNGVRSYSPQVSLRVRGGNYRTTYSHPEQRRFGEELYTKTHSDRDSRREDNPVINNNRRRSDSQMTRQRTSSGADYSSSHGSSTPVRDSRNTNQHSVQRTDASHRSSSNFTERSVNNPSTGDRANVSHRPSGSLTDKPVSRRDQGNRGGTQKISGRSKSSVGAPGQGNRRNKAVNSADKKTKSNNSEKDNSSHRQ